jgi:hypothetical protein
MKFYSFVKQASVILRGLLFESLIEQLNVTDNILYNYLISIAVSYVIHAISYGAVGLFYSKGENPAAGAFMYFVAYVNYTFWAWLGLKCYILTTTTGSFVDILLYIAIGGIVIVNIFIIKAIMKLSERGNLI